MDCLDSVQRRYRDIGESGLEESGNGDTDGDDDGAKGG